MHSDEYSTVGFVESDGSCAAADRVELNGSFRVRGQFLVDEEADALAHSGSRNCCGTAVEHDVVCLPVDFFAGR